jgi:hypothetical protein
LVGIPERLPGFPPVRPASDEGAYASPTIPEEGGIFSSRYLGDFVELHDLFSRDNNPDFRPIIRGVFRIEAIGIIIYVVGVDIETFDIR